LDHFSKIDKLSFINNMSFGSQWRHYNCHYDKNYSQPKGNLIVIQLTGFNYSYIPDWYNEELHKMMSVNFYVDPDNMYYEWSFYRLNKHTGFICYISTSDNIVPVIHNRITGEKAHVQRVNFHNGYTLWKVSFNK